MEVFLYNSTVCRLCGEENDNGTLLYSCEENNQNLSEIINTYLPIKVEDDEELPRTICPGCTIQLEATVEFLNLIINGQKIIRELYQREKEYKKSILSNSNANGSVSEKIIYEINTNDGVYQVEHPIALQVAGLEKPKRKRGRPPKKQKTTEELAEKVVEEEQETLEPNSKNTKNDEEEPSGKRRRKTPTRYKEAVQGKELERIFIEVGVIDGEESDRETKGDEEPKDKSPVIKEPQIIGHVDKSGEPVVVVKNKGRGRPKGRSQQTREECSICGMEFMSRGRYMSHVASHGPVLYRCNCGIAFNTKISFTEHQKETGHNGRTIERCPSETSKDSTPTNGVVTLKQENSIITSKEGGQTSASQTLTNVTVNIKHDIDDVDKEEDPLKIDTTGDGEHEFSANSHVEGAAKGANEPKTASEDSGSTKTKIKCNNCDKFFSNRQSKSLHNKAVHLGEKNYACNECDARFAYPRSLAVHRVSHRRGRPHRGFACDLCGKVLNHPSSVVYHKQAEHAEQRYVCGTCGKRFHHKQLLQRHQLVHSQLRPFVCKTCNSTFKTKANLLNHQLLHSGIKKFTCEICKQKFAHKTSLTLHMRWHTGVKPFACGVCGKSFSQKGNLSEHERIHTGEKPYQCSVCPRRFTTSSQHRLHARRHITERAHACAKCGKRFASRTSWALHVRRDDCAIVRNKRAIEKIKQGNKQISLLVNDKNTFTQQTQVQIQPQVQYQTAGYEQKLSIVEENDNDSEERVIYVAYDADDSQTGAFHILDPEQAVNMENDKVLTTCQLYSGSSLLMPQQLETIKLETEELHLEMEQEQPEEQQLQPPPHQQQLVLNGNSIPVTDERGNPLHFTMQDGTKLAITSVDGKSLQVVTQDGQTIPVEINGFNDEEESAGADVIVPPQPAPVTHYYTIV